MEFEFTQEEQDLILLKEFGKWFYKVNDYPKLEQNRPCLSDLNRFTWENAQKLKSENIDERTAQFYSSIDPKYKGILRFSDTIAQKLSEGLDIFVGERGFNYTFHKQPPVFSSAPPFNIFSIAYLRANGYEDNSWEEKVEKTIFNRIGLVYVSEAGFPHLSCLLFSQNAPYALGRYNQNFLMKHVAGFRYTNDGHYTIVYSNITDNIGTDRMIQFQPDHHDETKNSFIMFINNLDHVAQINEFFRKVQIR